MIDKLIGRKVAIYLNETETPLEGYFQGIHEGFVVLSERNNPDAEMSLIDRDSIWCITVPEVMAELMPQ
jgi:hypothetical protein